MRKFIPSHTFVGWMTSLIRRWGLSPAILRSNVGGAVCWGLAGLAILAIYASPKHLISVQTAITGLLGLGVVAIAARWPDRSLIALIILLPFNVFILAKLWSWGVPASLVRHLSGWKEALAIGVVVAGIRNYLATGRRADALDRIGLGFVAIVVLYLLAQKAILPSSSEPTGARLLAFRQDAGFVLLLLGARHAPLPANFLQRAGKAAIATAVVVAGLNIFEALDSVAWNRFVVNTLRVTRYEIDVLHGFSPNPFDVREWANVGGAQVIRAGSVFLSPLTCGFYLVLGWALALERVARGHGRRLMLASLVVIGAGLLLTETRSAILGALVVTFLAFRPAAGRRRHWRTQLAIVVAALAIIAVPAAVSTGVVKRVTAPTTNSDNSGHISAFWEGVHSIEHHPLGLGLGSSAGVGQLATSDASQVVVPENDYLQVGVELGLLPMLVFILMTGVWIRTLRSAARRRPSPELAAAASAAAGLAVTAWFLQVWIDFTVAWTVWGLAGAALGAARARVPERETARWIPGDAAGRPAPA